MAALFLPLLTLVLTHTRESINSKNAQEAPDILTDPEYRDIKRVARSRHMPVTDWVRQALAAASREDPAGSIARKLEAVHTAVRHEFPAGDIDHMLAEIGGGYTGIKRGS
jgi:hypothetical protein